MLIIQTEKKYISKPREDMIIDLSISATPGKGTFHNQTVIKKDYFVEVDTIFRHYNMTLICMIPY